MPSTTYASNHLVNIGPLTTTFTAPSSCATALSSIIGIGARSEPWNGPLQRPDCEPILRSDCWPGGTSVDEELAYLYATTAFEPQNPILYYSPANICPSGWATVGSVAKDAEGSLETSWVFEEGITTSFASLETGRLAQGRDPPYFIGWVPEHVNWAGALLPEETGIACCPSGYQPNPYLGCYSTADFSEWTAPSACWAPRMLVSGTADHVTTTVTAFNLTSEVVLQTMEPGAMVQASPTWFEVRPPGHRVLIGAGSASTITVSGEPVVVGGHTVITTTVSSAVEERVALYSEKMMLLVTGGPEAETETEGTESVEESGAAETSGGGEGGDEESAGVRRGGVSGAIGVVLAAWVGAMVVGGMALVQV